jgi:uncharacterized protein DUF5615
MKLYHDDDVASSLLAKLLRIAAHDALMPADVGMSGAADAVHLTRAIRDSRACLARNYVDFWILHNLIRQAEGRHPGILVVRQDNDPTRDMTPKGVANAIRRLADSSVPIENEFINVNHWR